MQEVPCTRSARISSFWLYSYLRSSPYSSLHSPSCDRVLVHPTIFCIIPLHTYTHTYTHSKLVQQENKENKRPGIEKQQKGGKDPLRLFVYSYNQPKAQPNHTTHHIQHTHTHNSLAHTTLGTYLLLQPLLPLLLPPAAAFIFYLTSTTDLDFLLLFFFPFPFLPLPTSSRCLADGSPMVPPFFPTPFTQLPPPPLQSDSDSLGQFGKIITCYPTSTSLMIASNIRFSRYPSRP
ncbi:hypothetical protein F4809DRAFT_21881 [Biscogniauxia mediterranea]|nr:hypothetical protein F4809DRAFT_21881 [Biscogniauxia mediterranea]